MFFTNSNQPGKEIILSILHLFPGHGPPQCCLAAAVHSQFIPIEYAGDSGRGKQEHLCQPESSQVSLAVRQEPPDSILCFNSLIAVGVIQAIRQFHLRIPEDISIVSFDNYPYAPLITPSLTVVDIDMYSLGTRAGASLLKKIQNPEMLIQTYTALPHLIQRDSTVLHSET